MKTLSVMLLALALATCGKPTRLKLEDKAKTNEPTNNENGGGTNHWNTDIPPGRGYGTGNEAGVADAGQTRNYYTENIVVTGTHRRTGTSPLWSSKSLSAGAQQKYVTDDRFHIRVIPREGTYSSSGNCHYPHSNFTQVTVEVALTNGRTTVKHTFNHVPLNRASQVHRSWNPPSHSTSKPLELRIIEVKTDNWCQTAWRGSSCTGATPYMNKFSYRECIKLDIQFATNDTKTFP